MILKRKLGTRNSWQQGQAYVSVYCFEKVSWILTSAARLIQCQVNMLYEDMDILYIFHKNQVCEKQRKSSKNLQIQANNHLVGI